MWIVSLHAIGLQSVMASSLARTRLKHAPSDAILCLTRLSPTFALNWGTPWTIMDHFYSSLSAVWIGMVLLLGCTGKEVRRRHFFADRQLTEFTKTPNLNRCISSCYFHRFWALSCCPGPGQTAVLRFLFFLFILLEFWMGYLASLTPFLSTSANFDVCTLSWTMFSTASNRVDTLGCEHSITRNWLPCRHVCSNFVVHCRLRWKY